MRLSYYKLFRYITFLTITVEAFSLPASKKVKQDNTSITLTLDDLQLNQDWNESIYETLSNAAHWSQISYCQTRPWGNRFKPGPLVSACPNVKFCSQDKSKNCIEVIETFKPRLEEKEISGTAFIAVDHCEKKLMISFRGSKTLGDWMTDFAARLVPYAPILSGDGDGDGESAITKSNVKNNGTANILDHYYTGKSTEETFPSCKDCFVHFGIYNAYSTLIPKIFKAAKPYLDSDYQLFITGHSLGGGYVYLAGIDFLLAGYKPLAISFASLRIGNSNFNIFVDSKFNTKENTNIIRNGGDLPVPSFSRIYQQSDFIPRLPPFPGYTHSGLEFVITKLLSPHLKKDIYFKGASNNYENDSFEFQRDDLLSWSFAYQHIYQITRLSIPCDDRLFLNVPIR